MLNDAFKLLKQVKIIRLTMFLLITSFLYSCGFSIERSQDSAPARTVDVSSIPDAIPKVEPKSRYGNPKSYEVFGKRYYVMNDARGFAEKGIASWYGTKFHGKRTSSGETYDMYAMTAAHKTLPLPTYAEVINLKNGRRIIVKVNDRGPFHENRIIDLSYTAATKLDIVGNGTGLVEIKAIDPTNFAGKGHSEGYAPVRTVSTGIDSQGFYIQVGSFSKLINAEKLRKKLGSIGSHLVRINQAVVGGEPVYRVRIGPLTNIDTADSIVSQLPGLNIQDHRIVVDLSKDSDVLINH